MPRRAVVAARDVREVKADEVQELREGEAEHREVDAATPQAEVTDDRATEGGKDESGPRPSQSESTFSRARAMPVP